MMVPERWRLLYSPNPMAGVIDGFRWSILRAHDDLCVPGLLITISVIGSFLWSGVRQFRSIERSFADLI
jgi:lipopolysaccharide transport system permease protein